MSFIDIYLVGPGAAGSNQKQKLWVPDLEWYPASRWVNRLTLNTNDTFVLISSIQECLAGMVILFRRPDCINVSL